MRTTFIQKTSLALVLSASLSAFGCMTPAAEGDGAASADENAAVTEEELLVTACGDRVHSDGELCFSPAAQVSASGANAVVAGRLNAGSNLDFAATTSADLLRIRLGNGSGGFSSSYNYDSGDGPSDVAIGDFNADGLMDVVANNYSADQVRVRWGGGGTPWGGANSYGVGDGPLHVEAGDLDADGHDDLVTMNGVADTLTVRRGTATGFAAAQTYSAGFSGTAPRLADCDGDGDLDLFYASGTNENVSLNVRRNDGAGGFGAPVVTDLGTDVGASAHSLTVGDWNEDGLADVVVTLNQHAMVRALGTGGCGFGGTVTVATEPNPVHIYNADMDMDGHLDLVIGHFNGMEISIYRGSGSGNFYSPKVIATGDWVSDLALGDYTGDGSPDVLFVGPGGIYMLPSNP